MGNKPRNASVRFSTLQEAVAWHANVRPAAPAILDDQGQILTYAGLHELIGTTRQRLGELGLGVSDRVILLCEEGVLSAVTAIATLASLACIPMRAEQTRPEFEAALKALKPAALIAQAGMDSPAFAAVRQAGVPVLETRPTDDGRAGAFVLHGPAIGKPRALAGQQPGDTTLLLHTSGTTGHAKCVPYTGSSLSHATLGSAAAIDLKPDDRCLCVLPPVHVHGLITGLLVPLYSGGSTICIRDFRVSRYFDLLATYNPSWYSLPPPLHRAIVREIRKHTDTYHGHGLRFVRSGSMPMPASLAREVEQVLGVPLIEAYGMTEAPNISAGPVQAPRPGSVGRSAGPEIEIRDAGGRPLPPGETGDIFVRGASVAAGYLDDPAASGRSFRNGWLDTGDHGYLDRDGYLYLRGRRDDIIIRGGDNIDPVEVEEALARHPGVEAAVAYPVPHRVLGQDLAVAVVPVTPGALTSSALHTFLRDRLSPYKQPASLVLVDEIPAGPGGKPRRRLLHEQLAASGKGKADARTHPPAAGLESLVAGIWSEVLDVRPGSNRDHFFDMGGTSLDAAIVVEQVGKLLGEPLYMTAMYDHPSLGDFTAWLEHNYPGHVARLSTVQGQAEAITAVQAGRVTDELLGRFRSTLRPEVFDAAAGPSAGNPPAIFILSAPRSGSTLLRSMLAGHPGLFAPPELRLLHFGNITDWQAWHSGRHAFFREGLLAAVMSAMQLDLAGAEQQLQRWLDARRPTREVLAEIQRALGDRILVDKTPLYANDTTALARMESWFENTRYIHLLRHPGAVVSSYERNRMEQLWQRPVTGTPRQLGELLWIDANTKILNFIENIPADRRCNISFESLVRRPDQVMRQLCAHFGLDFDMQYFQPYTLPAQRMTTGIREGSRPIGDTRFLEHEKINPAIAHAWLGHFDASVLSELTWSVATRMEHFYRDTPAAGPANTSPGPQPEKPVAVTPTPVALERIALIIQTWPGSKPAGTTFIAVRNRHGRQPPLFWCFQRQHEFTALAEQLGPDQPLYGMRSGHGVMEKLPQQIRGLGRQYARDVMACQTTGPYRLGGNCQGGRIAFEIALALIEAGHKVDVLFLMELFLMRDYPGHVALLYGDNSQRHNPYFTHVAPETAWRRLYETFTVDILSGKHGQFFASPNVEILAKTVHYRLNRGSPGNQQAGTG